MANTRLEFLEKKYYNIYNCWYNKQKIFLEDKDFEKFYSIILKYLRLEKNVKLISYCFIDDHFHLILYSLKNGYSISDFMRKIQLSYSIYFKNKYSKLYQKSLFEWRFRSQIIGNLEYLHQSLAFTNFNPIHHNLINNILDYKYTSYHRLISVGTNHFEQYKLIKLDELEF